jgi:transcriptional regulator with XRE-family HTH domain
MYGGSNFGRNNTKGSPDVMAATRKTNPLDQLPVAARDHVATFIERLTELADPDVRPARRSRLLDEADQAVRIAEQRCVAHSREQAARAADHVVDFAQAVGENVRRLRDEAAMTQAELAEVMSDLGFDWKRITVAEAERGSRRLQLEELLGLAALFGQPMSWLLEPAVAGHVRLVGDRSLDAALVRDLVRGATFDGDPEWPSARDAIGIAQDEPDWRPAAAIGRRLREANR